MTAAVQPVDSESVADESSWNRTPHRSIRLEQELWDQLGDAAKAFGYDRSSLIRQLIRWYLGVPGAKPPPRPASEDSGETAG